MRLSRNDFLANLGFGAFLATAGSAMAIFARFLTPNLVTPRPGPIEIGTPADYPVGVLTYVEAARVYVGRDDRGFYALIAVCTHLGCLPRPERKSLVCPCHGSRFALDGQVISGPARRALDRAFVGRASNGKLFVDRSRLVHRDYRMAV